MHIMKISVPLLVAFVLLTASGCDIAGPHPPVAVNHVHTSPTPNVSSSPTPAGSAPTAPAPTSLPTPVVVPTPGTTTVLARCHTGVLLVSFAGSQGAAGTIVDTFRVANTSTSRCVILGYVGMLMLDAAGRPLPTHVVRNGGVFSTEAGPSGFSLEPGTAASFQAAWSDVPHGSEGPCPQAAQLEVTPPDEYDHRLISVSGWSLAPCGGGEIDVTPIRAAGPGPA
ncbi:MAG: hypothetical protein DLM66_09240 [Candidatus Dormiibacter spiritus]|nr:MAG: hypothetical protein DLM66_09240 [Candidatus Dormibacteraeota bacterium]